MCQLCTLKPTFSNHRWPKPLESHISNLNLLLSTSHAQHQSFLSTSDSTNASNENKKALLSTLLDISTLLCIISDSREKWWQSKKEMRKQLTEEGNEEMLRKLQVLNNETKDRVESCKAKLGLFCRWSMGLEGGVELESKIKEAEEEVKKDGEQEDGERRVKKE